MSLDEIKHEATTGIKALRECLEQWPIDARAVGQLTIRMFEMIADADESTARDLFARAVYGLETIEILLKAKAAQANNN